MAGTSNSREQNYWPGFVDALTNVVLVMVFVVVVFATSMIATMLKLAKAQVEMRVEQQMLERSEEVSQQVLEARQAVESERLKTETLEKENEQLKAALRAAKAAAVIGQPAPSPQVEQKQAPVMIQGVAPSIVVSYALGVTTLEKKLFDAFDAAVAGYQGAGNWKVTLHARMAEPSASQGRRLAFYRIALLRDHLVKQGVNPARIETVILDAPSTDGRSSVTVRLWKTP